jgi:hypothetical protein
MKKYQDGGDTRPVQNAPKVTISPSSGSSKTPVKKAPTKKANPPRGTMDLIRGSKKSDYEGTVTLAAKKGGAVKKYQDGGRTISQKAAARKTAKGKGFTSYSYGTKDAPGSEGNKGNYIPFTRQGRQDAKETGRVSSNEMKSSRKIMKTGGMVNSNAKVSALKSAGSHGVKSGVNPKAAASKVARGKVGGISSAPKTAVPKAKYGMSMRKK